MVQEKLEKNDVLPKKHSVDIQVHRALVSFIFGS